jgi:hypothetical protein
VGQGGDGQEDSASQGDGQVHCAKEDEVRKESRGQ